MMRIKQKRYSWLLMGLLVLVQGPGCASSYHRYSDCCGVNCRYCEPAPLPYQHYPGCVCHSQPGARYLSDPITRQTTENRSEPEQLVSPVKLESTIEIGQRPYDE